MPYLPLERIKPMFDTFQSCFKDKYCFKPPIARGFAGLYFLYKPMALLSYLITDSLSYKVLYCIGGTTADCNVDPQAITYPYCRHWHNNRSRKRKQGTINREPGMNSQML